MDKNIKKKQSFKIILSIILIVFTTAGILLYYNFNHLLSQALMNSFNSSILSEVYELKFEKLNVNFLTGNIKVINVVMQPLEKPVHDYPYINSSFRLKTKKLILKEVNIRELLKFNKLQLEKIVIGQPEIELMITDKVPIFFPFNDTTALTDQPEKKKSIIAFGLKEFELSDANLHTINTAQQREFNVSNLNIALYDLLIDQRLGKDLLSYNQVAISVESFDGNMQKSNFKHFAFKNFKLTIDSLAIEKTVDTLIYNFQDLKIDLKTLDIQTTDSVFHIAMGPFQVSYKNKSVKMNNIIFKPNVKHAAIQKNYKYQHTEFATTVGSISINGLNFDSLIYQRKIFIDEIIIDKLKADIYKDNTKPIDSSRFPKYFGEQIRSIPTPILIKQVKATNVNLVNTERKPDGSYGKAHINRGIVTVTNITNHSTNKPLTLNAKAYIENKAPVNLTLKFDYLKPQFSIDGKISKFNLPDLNALLQSFTPAKINNGVSDEISFSGIIYGTYSTGTFKFLYHDLNLDLELKEKAKWKSSVLAFAANTAIHSSNPISVNQPPRIVQFKAERNMHKGFVNIMIKSVLSGLKETIIMSKENRKAYKEVKAEKKAEKKEVRKEVRKEEKKKKKQEKNK